MKLFQFHLSSIVALWNALLLELIIITFGSILILYLICILRWTCAQLLCSHKKLIFFWGKVIIFLEEVWNEYKQITNKSSLIEHIHMACNGGLCGEITLK